MASKEVTDKILTIRTNLSFLENLLLYIAEGGTNTNDNASITQKYAGIPDRDKEIKLNTTLDKLLIKNSSQKQTIVQLIRSIKAWLREAVPFEAVILRDKIYNLVIGNWYEYFLPSLRNTTDIALNFKNAWRSVWISLTEYTDLFDAKDLNPPRKFFGVFALLSQLQQCIDEPGVRCD